jgi:hypothetical protein
LKLRTIAEIATITAVIIAFLQYADIEPNALDKIPDLYKSAAESDVESLVVTVAEEDYEGENRFLFYQYKAAISIPEKYSKDNAIKKVVSSALQSRDIKLAVAAAKEMEEKYAKSSTLEKIVESALYNGDEAGYAVIAAELIPEKYSKSNTLEKIVKHYQTRSTINNPGNPPTELEMYKVIYSFADVPATMSMSGKDARAFTEKWLKTREFSQFRFYSMVFEFADASAHLNMSSGEATAFALDYIDSYTKDEFLIYQESFKFSDSPSGMSLSTEDAMVFASNKVIEHRALKEAANKAVQPTAESGG